MCPRNLKNGRSPGPKFIPGHVANLTQVRERDFIIAFLLDLCGIQRTYATLREGQ